MLKIDHVVVSEYETNCYMVINDNQVLIIDPGAEFNKIDNYIKLNKLKPVGYLITHEHEDHIEALNDVIKAYGIEEMVSNDNFNFEIISTPGHTIDGKCFYFKDERLIFTGDTLFKETIGRMDLGGNHKEMFASLKLLKQLPDDTVVYPGHGDTTTIGYEKLNNIWLK